MRSDSISPYTITLAASPSLHRSMSEAGGFGSFGLFGLLSSKNEKREKPDEAANPGTLRERLADQFLEHGH